MVYDMVKMNLTVARALLLLMASSFAACEKDEVKVATPPEDQVIKPGSEVAGLLQRISLLDGSSDNIIDHASCLSLVFPCNVTVNGIEVDLNSKDDLGVVEDILDEFTDDEDILTIQFPITVMLENFTTAVVENQNELSGLANACIENGDDDDIECVDLIFPIKLSVYDAARQVANVITLKSDGELYAFLHDLKDDDIASFIFPVTFLLSGGAEIVATDASSLRNLIKDFMDDCDEDDDDDHNDDDDVDVPAFEDVLTSGEWAITYYFEDGEDDTSLFEDFKFNFDANGTFIATIGGDTFPGTWKIKDDDHGLELEFDVDEDSLKEIDGNWKLMEFDGERIRFRDSSGGNTTYLTFEKN